MEQLFVHVPNMLTFLRLGLIPVFVVLMIDPSDTMVGLATLVFTIAAVTDYVDGYVARKWQVVSDFGKLLDPLADKILVMTALVMLVAQRSEVYGEPWVPGWMVVLVLAREIWVTGLRGIAASEGLIVPASAGGKVKSVLQFIAVIFLLLHDWSFEFFGLTLTCQIIGINLLLASIVFSYVAAVEYTHEILWRKPR